MSLPPQSLNRSRWQALSRVVHGFLISMLLVLAGSASFAFEADNSMAIDLSRYEGHWHQIDAVQSDEAREFAIEDAVKGLSWIVRRMASGVLRRTTAPPPELQFAWDGEHLFQGLADENGGFSRPVELDGEPRVLKDRRGEDFASAWAWTDRGLRLHWEQKQAYGYNVYRLDGVTKTLIVEHTVNVTAISNVDPIVYLSRFQRTDLPARAAAGLDNVGPVPRN